MSRDLSTNALDHGVNMGETTVASRTIDGAASVIEVDTLALETADAVKVTTKKTAKKTETEG